MDEEGRSNFYCSNLLLPFLTKFKIIVSCKMVTRKTFGCALLFTNNWIKFWIVGTKKLEAMFVTVSQILK